MLLEYLDFSADGKPEISSAKNQLAVKKLTSKRDVEHSGKMENNLKVIELNL